MREREIDRDRNITKVSFEYQYKRLSFSVSVNQSDGAYIQQETVLEDAMR